MVCYTWRIGVVAATRGSDNAALRGTAMLV